MYSTAEYYDRQGRALSRELALDRNGIIRDGVISRIRMTARDGAAHGFKDASFTDAHQFWDINRDSLLVTDAHALGGTEGNRPGFRVLDAPVNRQAINDAYRAYEDDLVNAYKNPGPRGRSNPETDTRTESRAREPSLSLDQLRADHARNMEPIYAQYAQDLQNAWRKGKS
jgi:hypothetical protein